MVRRLVIWSILLVFFRTAATTVAQENSHYNVLFRAPFAISAEPNGDPWTFSQIGTDCPCDACACCSCECAPVSAATPRFSIRHDVGDGVGYHHGFTYLEGFIPLQQGPGQNVLFGDVRVVNFTDDRFWEFNAGLGWRQFDADANRIYGFNVFYDGRHTNIDLYHQIGVGFEVLSEKCDLRLNGYFPVGATTHFVGLANPRIVATNIVSDRIVEGAFTGFDAEVGAPITGLQDFNAKAFVGCYYYHNDELPDEAFGVSGRLEAWITDQVSLHFSVQHDDVFDTTVNGGLAFHFGGGRPLQGLSGGPRTVQQRLGDRVVRDPNIVVDRQTGGLDSFGIPQPKKKKRSAEERRSAGRRR